MSSGLKQAESRDGATVEFKDSEEWIIFNLCDANVGSVAAAVSLALIIIKQIVHGCIHPISQRATHSL